MAVSTPIAVRAGPSQPCPVCSSPSKGCSITVNAMHLCRGEPVVPSEWRRITKVLDSAGFHHYRNNTTDPATGRHPSPSAPKVKRARRATSADWAERAQRYAADLRPQDRDWLAGRLGVPVDALETIPLIGSNGASTLGPTITFPEFDGAERIVGLSERVPGDPADDKRIISGGHRGLTIPHGWRDRDHGPVFVVEGPSDTLAMVSAGLVAVGRPGADIGVDQLARLLQNLPPDRPIIIVGENDRKPPGSVPEWPGRDGCIRVAAALAAELKRPVRAAMPPPPAKDVRAWLTHPDRAGVEWAERGRGLASWLTSSASAPPPMTEANGQPNDRNRSDPAEEDQDPHRLARECRDRIERDVPESLRYWRETWYVWRDGFYAEQTKAEMLGIITRLVKRYADERAALRLSAWEAKGDKSATPPRGPFPITTRLLGDVTNALKSICLLGSRFESPGWLSGSPPVDVPAGSDFIPCQNGVLAVPCPGAGAGGSTDPVLIPPSPDYFVFGRLAFDYDPAAPDPAEWIGFLRTLWSDDEGCTDALQEWLGYLLTSDTTQQKILMLIGPPRSGKGTILKVIQAMVGPDHCAGASLSGLSGSFGLSGLMNKSVALITDARMSARTDTAIALERLLSVSGEDAVPVNRKNKEEISARLSVRFVIATNELPKFADASSAITSRFVVLPLTRSFLGREDTRLYARIAGEFPRIFRWALTGLQRLRDRGRFVQPKTADEYVQDWQDIVSPVQAFVTEECVLGANRRVERSELYRAFKRWCDAEGKHSTSAIVFGRDLSAAYPESVRRSQPRGDGRRGNLYTGIALRDQLSDPVESGAKTPAQDAIGFDLSKELEAEFGQRTGDTAA